MWTVVLTVLTFKQFLKTILFSLQATTCSAKIDQAEAEEGLYVVNELEAVEWKSQSQFSEQSWCKFTVQLVGVSIELLIKMDGWLARWHW